MKKCPYCDEEIQNDAIKCRYCAEFLNAEPPAGEPCDPAEVHPPASGPVSKPPETTPSSQGAKPLIALLIVGALVLFITLVSNYASTDRGDLYADRYRIGSVEDALAAGRGADAVNTLAGIAERMPNYKGITDDLRARVFEVGVRTAEELFEKDYLAALNLARRVATLKPSNDRLEALIAKAETRRREAEAASQQKRDAIQERALERKRLVSRREGVIYAKGAVNIRSGPGPSHDVVRQTKDGEILFFEGRTGEWYKLNVASGGEWVHESVVLTEAEKRVRASAQLALLSWSWHKEYGYAKAEGRVRNVSGRTLENVEALVQWYTSSGGFITSADCLIDYNPILPGQASPFKCSTTVNPAMRKARIEFKTLFGGRLSHYKD